jgi:hypothetical protein
MALELASVVACKDLTAATRDSTVVLRSSRSPMAAAQDAVDEDQERAARRLVVARECGAVRKPWIVIPGCQGRRD